MSKSLIEEMTDTVNKIKKAADELTKLAKKNSFEDFLTNYTETIKKTYGSNTTTKTGLSASKTDNPANT